MAFLMRSFYAQIKNVHKNKWTKLCLLISFFKGLTVEVAVSWRIINASTVQCHFKLNWTFSRKITKKRGQISLIQTFLTNTADWIILKWMLPLQITERPLSLLLFFLYPSGHSPRWDSPWKCSSLADLSISLPLRSIYYVLKMSRERVGREKKREKGLRVRKREMERGEILIVTGQSYWEPCDAASP